MLFLPRTRTRRHPWAMVRVGTRELIFTGTYIVPRDEELFIEISSERYSGTFQIRFLPLPEGAKGPYYKWKTDPVTQRVDIDTFGWGKNRLRLPQAIGTIGEPAETVGFALDIDAVGGGTLLVTFQLVRGGGPYA
jgi:hypothetical protein